MHLIVIASIAVWLAATGYSILLPGKVRDRRLGLLAPMLALMALGQVAALLSPTGPLATLATPPNAGPYSLLVGTVALLAVYSLDRVFLDQRQAQDDERSSEIMYRTLAEFSPAGLFYDDASGRCVFVNKCWCNITGQSVEEALGTGWAHRIHPDDAQRAAETFRAGQRERRPFIRGEFRLVRPGGQTVWALWQAAMARGSDGEAAGYVGTITDISDLKRAEAQLEEARDQLETGIEERTAHLVAANRALEAENARRKQLEQALGESVQLLQAILDNTPAIVWVRDIDGRFKLINKRYEKLFNVTRAEVYGKALRDVFPREVADTIRQNDLKVLEANAAMEFEETIQQDDGPHQYIEIRFPLRDVAGTGYAACGIMTDVTERMRARQDRDRIFELSLDVMCTGRFDGYVGVCNPAFKSVLGYQPEELRGVHFSEMLHPDDHEKGRAGFDMVMAGVPLEDFEVRWRCKDGSYKWLSWKVVPVIAEQRTYSVGRDVTVRKLAEEATVRFQKALERENAERKKAEQALRESEGRLQAILDNTPAVIHVKDMEGRYQLVNRRFEELCHVTREEASGKTAYDILPREAAEASRANDLKVLETNAALQFEETIMQDDGSHQYVSIRFPLRDASGAPVALSCIATDVTEFVRTQRERDRIFNLVPVILGTTNHEGRMTVTNPAWESVLGYRSEELSKMHFSELVHPDDRDRALATFGRLLDGIPIFDYENRWVCRDGSVRWLSWTVIPVPGEEVLLAVGVDITSRKLTQETVRHHRDEIAHLLRVHTMGELASQIAHELNQPLSAIASYASGVAMRLEAGGTPTAEIVDVVRKIAEQALEAGGLINRIREFAKKGELRFEPVDVNKLIEAAVAILKSGVNQKVEFRLELDPSLPEIDIDAAQIEQVMVNLMRNAIEAMEAGGEGNHLLLVSTSRTDPDHIEFAVRDEGVGLPPGRLDEIFEPFFTTKPSGLGMGLAISRTIMDAHGGRLWASRNPDGGATFRGMIPVRQEPA